jgi:putative flippase GtrA
MSALTRWLRFNLVGAMGMGLQLSVLTLLSRIPGGHYLVASTVAVEMAVLHNFLWHVNYTWRDREASTLWPRLWRFHLSNGAVSLLGSLVLMRLFVQAAHMPVLVANLMAIACCSIVNFLLGDSWAFA